MNIKVTTSVQTTSEVRTSMESVPIYVENLTKAFKGKVAVNSLSFTCMPGTVTGLLGDNGSGKSTTLRMMVGLSHPDKGRCLFYGHSYRDINNPALLMGVMLDASSQHPGRSGPSHLKIAAKATGRVGVNHGLLLEKVGLADVGNKRLGDYSLGMKQRLGLAQALIGDPTILILDEPANGLDPRGIQWMRDFLANYAAEGGTVLLSSHYLSEVEKLAERVVIISDGRKVFEQELKKTNTTSTSVTVTESFRLESVLREEKYLYKKDQAHFVIEIQPEVLGELLLRRKFVVTSMSLGTSSSLEKMFMNVTAKEPSNV